jgi:osmoprotectant transport system permease protein
MQAESTPYGAQRSLWQEMLNGWMRVLTGPNQETFQVEKSKANYLKTVLGLGLLGLLIGLLALVIQPSTLVIGEQNAFIDLALVILFTEAGFFALNLIIFLLAKAFRGQGNFAEQSYLLSLVAVPLGVILAALFFAGDKLGLTMEAILNPLSVTGIVSILVILLTLYSFLLVLFALRTAHNMEANKVLYTLGLILAGWAVYRIITMISTNQENMITELWAFIAQQWARGFLQEAFLGHFWLVLFSVLVAVLIGVFMGVLITLPSSKPGLSHLFFLIPFAIFLFLWAAASGVFGQAVAAQINDTVTGWDRSLRSSEGFFASLFAIVGSIVRKPAAIGMIGAGLTVILYLLLLAGERASDLTLYIAGIILTIPSIALFGVLIKPLGIGAFNAAFALILYAQLPILRNTYTGIREVQPEIVEAGRGMGMTEVQLLLQVKLPLAVPVIMTGVRISIVMLIGIAAIAAYIGNDTLGEYIFSGIQRAQDVRSIAGAVVVALLALSVDFLLGWIQDRLTPVGLREG